MHISSTISHRIQNEIAKLEPEPLGHINFDGIRYGALPLFGTLGEVWLLRADGSLWRADSETNLPLEPLPEGLHRTALIAGTERYPWLQALLPPRPAEAVDCGNCGGLGRLGPGNALFCHICEGFGWLSNERA